LKTKLAGLAPQSREELILTIPQIFDEVLKDTLISVCLSEKKDFTWLTKNTGGYFH
jgi:hypothetical protein